MNAPTVLPNADTVNLATCELSYHLRQGDVFVTPKDADVWLVIENGKNAVSISGGHKVFSLTRPTSRDDLMEVCRGWKAVLILGALHVTTGV